MRDGAEGGGGVDGGGRAKEEGSGVNPPGAALSVLSDTNGRERLGGAGLPEGGKGAGERAGACLRQGHVGEGQSPGGEADPGAHTARAALAAQAAVAEADAQAPTRSGELVCVRRSEMRELLLTVQQLRAARGQEAARLVRARAALAELLALASRLAPGNAALRARERELAQEGLLYG